jgi:hypothetical protein
MSKRSVKIEEENLRLRNELKRLKTQIKHLKHASNNICPLPVENKQNIALHIHQRLEQGIFSPPKLPLRPKSPLSSHSRKSSRSPSFLNSSIFFDSNKENLRQEVKVPSPDFPKVKFLVPSERFDHLSSLNDTSRQNIDELQTLERENNMLKELSCLRKENEILRSQIRLKTPKGVFRNKLKKKNHSKKILEENFELASPVSTRSKVREIRPEVKSRRIVENRPGHKHSYSMVSPTPVEKRISRSPSVCSKSPNASFSDNFSFTESAKKGKRGKVECLDMPRTFDRSPCLNSSRISPSVTPRSKNCWNCDTLLYKGLSTSFCNKTHDD